MKMIHFIAVLALLWLASHGGQAALNIPGADGSDGALIVTASTTIDLGLAVTGAWDANNSANVGKGVYDPLKWAVVFKYSSVNIAPGVTVSFKHHATRAPVVWLVSGNVTNAGTLNLNGAAGGQGTVSLPESGPGGFRGGATGHTGLGPSGGFGPGGALDDNGHYGTGQPRSYGNSQIVPLLGGSGGSGRDNSYNGGGGGGAILIAASDTIALSGLISANGGSTGNAYEGSGGAIRIIADQIVGTGQIRALGGDVVGGINLGRTRLEANTISQSLDVNPITQLVSPNPVTLWPPADASTVRVVSVSNQSVSSDPKAYLQNNPADVTIGTSSAVNILLETVNFPTTGTVNVFIKPRNGVPSTYQASYVGGTTNLATWQVQRSFLPGYAVIQARAVAP